MSGSDSDLSDLGPEYGDEDEMMQASSEEEELDEDRGMMSDGDNESTWDQDKREDPVLTEHIQSMTTTTT